MGKASGYTEHLTCIDMTSPDLTKTAAQLRQACVDVGFFYLINHGLDLELLDKVVEESRKFFALPLEEKMKVLHDKNHRGYTPFEEEIFDPENQSKGDSKEGYYIGREVPETDPRSRKPLHGPNQFPSPDVLPGWQETMEQYFAEAIKLARRVARLIALALNLEETFFDKPGLLDDPMAVVRLLHYSGEKSYPEAGIYGAGAHSDYGMITLLATDDVPGLQFCRQKDAVPQIWEDVQPLKGAFIVNLGDMLERWSNGLFRSTLHRVLNPGMERYSIPFFFEPNFDCVVECLPTCFSDENPPKYPPITSGNHLLGKYRATHKGFKS